MALKTKTRYAEINAKKGGFSGIIRGETPIDFSDIQLIRSLLSNEKGRILHLLKHKEVGSIYGLAKELGRDFKSVHTDLKMLERFGFIDFTSHKKGKRKSLQPILTTDKINLIINV